MKKVLGIISLLLSATLATANSIDFDKAFKESTKENIFPQTNVSHYGLRRQTRHPGCSLP